MQIRQLFQLHCAFRSLRLLSGEISHSRRSYHIVGSGGEEPIYPGDLIFAPELRLPEETPRLLALVDLAAGVNGAGIIVRAPNGYRPPELEAASAAHGGLPVLALPLWGDMAFSLSQIHALLQGPQVYFQQICRAFQSDLARLLSRSPYYGDLLPLLTSYLQRDTALFSRRLLLPSSQDGDALREARRLWEEADPALLESPLCHLEGKGCSCFFFPVRDASRALASLCIVYPAGEAFPEGDRHLVQALLPHLASRLVKSICQMEVLYKQPEEFLEAILLGRFSNHPEQLERNARYLALDSQRSYVLWIMDGDTPAAISPSRLEEHLSALHRRFFRIPCPGRLVYLMEWEGPQAGELSAFCQTRFSALGNGFHISFSPCFRGLSGIPGAFSQADFTFKIGRKLSPSQTVYTYGEYLLYDFLDSVRHTPAIALIYQEVISALGSYDRANNTELLDTLRSLCANNFNAIQTADRMYLHRNSLYKRIDRISEILDMDLEQPDNRIILHLAVKLYDLFH